METLNSEPKKKEQFYRIFFRKMRLTKKYRGKIVYKDIWACSREEAIEIAKDFVRNSKKELELLSE